MLLRILFFIKLTASFFASARYYRYTGPDGWYRQLSSDRLDRLLHVFAVMYDREDGLKSEAWIRISRISGFPTTLIGYLRLWRACIRVMLELT